MQETPTSWSWEKIKIKIKLHGPLVEEPHLEIPIWSLWKYHFGPCCVWFLAYVPLIRGRGGEKGKTKGGNKVGWNCVDLWNQLLFMGVSLTHVWVPLWLSLFFFFSSTKFYWKHKQVLQWIGRIPSLFRTRKTMGSGYTTGCAPNVRRIVWDPSRSPAQMIRAVLKHISKSFR